MKAYCTVFTFLFSVFVFGGACAAMREFKSANRGDVLSLYDNVVISDMAQVYYNEINIKRTLLIENNGTLAGTINICNGCMLRLRNGGDISGARFTPGVNSRLVQMINSESDVTHLDTDMDYVILVQNANRLSLNNITSVAGPNTKIILENTSLILNSAITNAPEIELSGDVNLIIDGVFGNGPVLDNINGDGALNVYAGPGNSLMATRAEIINHKLYVQMLRETDYAKILKNSTGDFLNKLRRARPNDKLFRALDRAGDVSALNGVMSRSVRLRPINLMRPVRAMDATKMFFGMMTNGKNGFSLSPDFIYNDDFYITGLRIGMAAKITDVISAGASGYVGCINASDEINDFDARVVGGNIYTIYDDGEFIGRAMLGHSAAKFDVDFILVGDDIDSAPHGTNLYGATDFGVRLNPMDDFVFAPFIGLTASHTEIVAITENNFDTNIGTDITTTGGTDDFAYDYGVRVRASAHGNVGAALGVAFWSQADDAGVDMNVGIINSEFGPTYHASIGGRAIF